MGEPLDARRGRTLCIDVALAPTISAPRARQLAGASAIVVDVIRATTTLAVMFEHGCRRVYIAQDITTARETKSRKPDALLAGEVNGAAPAGFDLGNSPAEMLASAIAGRELIFATTNGTRALRACASASAVYAGALRNASVVCAAATVSAIAHSVTPGEYSHARPGPDAPSEPDSGEQRVDILIVCAGRGDRPAIDDTLCAGYLCQELVRQLAALGYATSLGEEARIALAALRGELVTGSLLEALARSDAAHAISSIGLASDLEWCAAINASQAIPRVFGRDEYGLLIIENQRPPDA